MNTKHPGWLPIVIAAAPTGVGRYRGPVNAGGTPLAAYRLPFVCPAGRPQIAITEQAVGGERFLRGSCENVLSPVYVVEHGGSTRDCLRHRSGTRNSSNFLGLNITIRSVGQEIVKAGRITFFRSDFAESPSSAEVLTKLSGRKDW
jgi:hypothetical protein